MKRFSLFFLICILLLTSCGSKEQLETKAESSPPEIVNSEKQDNHSIFLEESEEESIFSEEEKTHPQRLSLPSLTECV